MTQKKNDIDKKDEPGVQHAQPAILPEPTLRRLPWYLAYLTTLRHEDVEHVSSTHIAAAVGVDASQIAKDLSFLNIRGKTRIGYEVAVLERTLRRFLGFAERHNAVVVGAGSLGSALMADRGLHPYGLNIVAGFDVDPAVCGTEKCGVRVHHIDKLAKIAKRQDISIAAVTVPVECAQQVAETIMDAGIRAIWNFTPCRISVRPGFVVQNTSLYSHLAVMYNRLHMLAAETDCAKPMNGGGE
ncbi:MAG: redox-sensing transcriptional repressor Rex [Muribaculaceae bacterium]|nr:redox-sensing transcriptional repressor Rex [Muribaculaceae bacterium]